MTNKDDEYDFLFKGNYILSDHYSVGVYIPFGHSLTRVIVSGIVCTVLHIVSSCWLQKSCDQYIRNHMTNTKSHVTNIRNHMTNARSHVTSTRNHMTNTRSHVTNIKDVTCTYQKTCRYWENLYRLSVWKY